MDEETAEALTRTKALYDAGVLTEEEYNAKKNELLHAQPPANEHGGVVEGHVVAVQPQKVHPEPRPPPPARCDYTGPPDDSVLMSTEEISGDYRRCCFPFCCNWMTVVPHGPDAIEAWSEGCIFLPCFGFFGPRAEVGVRTRSRPGENTFVRPGENTLGNMWFGADGTATVVTGHDKDGRPSRDVYKKLPHPQKRAFQKVETRDLAGKWRGCCCNKFVPCWPLSRFYSTTKKALDEDRYEESGLYCVLGVPISVSETRTRKYVHGHPTNGFASDKKPDDVHWYRDPGCVGYKDESNHWMFFAKKVG